MGGLKRNENAPAGFRASKRTALENFADIGQWFQTICMLKIPVAGFIYMIVLLASKKTPVEKKSFLWGYFIYKALVWILAIVLIYCLYKVGLDFVDEMLKYIG